MSADGDNKIVILTQQCERLNNMIEKKNFQIRALGGQVEDARENLRLSSQKMTKLTDELNHYRTHTESSSSETETFRQRIQKLLAENNGLNEEVRNVQENLRLSTGQIGKLTGEFKALVVENEELKKRLNEVASRPNNNPNNQPNQPNQPNQYNQPNQSNQNNQPNQSNQNNQYNQSNQPNQYNQSNQPNQSNQSG